MTRIGTHIIAEAGTNHGGSLERGIQLIDHAAAAGATSVKFQIIHPEELYLSDYWDGDALRRNEVFDARTAMMLPDDAWSELADHTRGVGLEFGASVFGTRGLEILDDVGADYIKIASCDLNNGPLLRDAASYDRRLIVSTGMSTRSEVVAAVEQLDKAGAAAAILMHCTSVYPCPTSDSQLGFIDLLSSFGHPIGFSDHTEQSSAAAAAIALGATWIEKHITDDRAAAGFDHAYAMEPAMFANFVADIRALEQSLQSDRSTPVPAEQEVRERARRGLWAARDLAPGTEITPADVLVVRPEGAMAPNDLDRLIGRRIGTPMRRADPFRDELLEGSTADGDVEETG